MKKSLKALSFLFVISFLVLKYPLHAQVVEEIPKQKKDIQIIENPYEFGDYYDEERIDEYMVTNMSVEDIRQCILNGKPVYFIENQEEEKRTIEPALIIEALKNSVDKIDIRNAIITRDLDLRIDDFFIPKKEQVSLHAKRKGSWHILPPISIVDSIIKGNLLAGWIFEKSLITNVNFHSMVEFKGTNIMGDANFMGAIFQREVDFSKTTFQGKTEFSAADFYGSTYFAKTDFKSEVNFGGFFTELASYPVIYYDGPGLYGAKFHRIADFSEATFESFVNFGTKNVSIDEVKDSEIIVRVSRSEIYSSYDNKAIFMYAAIFYRTKFQGGVCFSRTIFPALPVSFPFTYLDEVVKKRKIGAFMLRNGTDFREAIFKESIDFRNAEFKGKVNFNSATFKDAAIFYGVSFDKEVDFTQTKYSMLRINWNQLEGCLDGSLSQMRDTSLEYLTTKIVQDQWQEVYLKIIKNFQNIGDTESADDAYYYYRCKKYMLCNSDWEKTKWWFGYLFMGLTCGYGVIPWRAISTAGTLISIFAFCIYFPFSKRDSLEFKTEKRDKQWGSFNKEINFSQMPWYERLYNCFYFSVIIFTTVGLGDIKPTGGFKAWAIIEGILGWLTMALFLVTLANVWLR